MITDYRFSYHITSVIGKIVPIRKDNSRLNGENLDTIVQENNGGEIVSVICQIPIKLPLVHGKTVGIGLQFRNPCQIFHHMGS